MSQVTYEDPIILDKTGERIAEAIEALAGGGGGGNADRESIFGNIETGTTASTGYVKDDLIWIKELTGSNDSHLFKVTANSISSGENWEQIASTKLVETSISDEEELKAAKSDSYLVGDTAETAIDDADTIPFYDTSATSKRKSTWSNIKSVLKTYFDTLYNKITVAVSKKGTASSSAFRKQVITIDNVDTEIDGSAYMEQSVTLSTSSTTTVTFTNAAIDDGAMLTVASSLWNLVPDDITLASGSCTITLPKWSTAETIGVRLYVR